MSSANLIFNAIVNMGKANFSTKMDNFSTVKDKNELIFDLVIFEKINNYFMISLIGKEVRFYLVL